MTKTILTVNGTSCEHCVKAITKTVEALPGISGVAVDLSAKTVTVEHDPSVTASDIIKLEIENQGYEVTV